MEEVIAEAAKAASLSQTAGAQENNQINANAGEAKADNWEMLSKEEAAAIKRPTLPGPVIIEAQEVAKPKIQTGMVRVALLRPYAKNAEIYEDREDPLFTESIRKNGVLTPLAVTEDGEVLGGNGRLREARRVGLEEVPVKVVVCKTEDEKLLRVHDDNLQRVKTNAEIAREYKARLELEARAAAVRKAGSNKKAEGQADEVEKFTPPPAKKKGKARDLAAKKFDLSGVTAEKGRKVLEAVAKARSKSMPEIADELLNKLNEKGFHAAFERAKALRLIVSGAPKARKANGAAKPRAAAPAAPAGNNAADAPAAAQADAANIGVAPLAAIAAEDDQPPVVGIIAAMNKVANDLNGLELTDATNDQKLNLTRVFDGLTDWFVNHDLMLKVLGQL
jgi:ParB-like chromosome segregation protein Spo0J